MKTIVIKSQFGHEIMAVNFAKAFNLDVVIAPNKDEKKPMTKSPTKSSAICLFSMTACLSFLSRKRQSFVLGHHRRTESRQIGQFVMGKVCCQQIDPGEYERPADLSGNEQQT